MKKVVGHPGVCVVLLTVLLLVGLALHRLEQLEVLQNQPKRVVAAMTVEGVRAHCGSISGWVSGEGTVSVVRKQNLVFEISGKINAVGTDSDGLQIREGSNVQGPGPDGSPGTLLAVLDNRNIQEEIAYIKAEQLAAENELKMAEATLQQSQVSLGLAEKQHARSKTLFAKNSEPRHLLEEALATVQNSHSEMQAAQARIETVKARIQGIHARLEQARVSLEKSIIHAPFDGVIAILNVQRGEYYDPSMVDYSSEASLQASAPITIVDPEEIEVTLDLPLFAGRKVMPGQRTHILTGPLDWYTTKESESTDLSELSLESYVHEGEVYSVSPVLGLDNRTIRVKIRARKLDGKLLHGMFVTCWIETEQKQDALLIPTASLLIRDDSPFVYVDDHGLARRQAVSLGLTDEAKVEVIAGLDEGDIVITKGRQRLYQEHPIKVIMGRDRSDEG